MDVRQVRPHERWPSGDSRAVAMLAAEPDELAERYGLMFEEGTDNLDRYWLAAVELADGAQVWLMRHWGNPVAGTVVYADANADPDLTRRLLARALVLFDTAFTWIAPPAEAAAMRAD